MSIERQLLKLETLVGIRFVEQTHDAGVRRMSGDRLHGAARRMADFFDAVPGFVEKCFEERPHDGKD